MAQTDPKPRKKKRVPKHMMSAVEQLELEDTEPKVDHRKIVLEMDLIDKSKLLEETSLNSSMALMKNRDPNALDMNDQIELIRRQLVLTEMGIEVPRLQNGEIDVKSLL